MALKRFSGRHSWDYTDYLTDVLGMFRIRRWVVTLLIFWYWRLEGGMAWQTPRSLLPIPWMPPPRRRGATAIAGPGTMCAARIVLTPPIAVSYTHLPLPTNREV